MNRSPAQWLSLVAAVLFGAAPLSVALLGIWSMGDDRRMVWMALVSTFFAAGVLAAAIGRRRSRQEAYFQSGVILLIATLLAGGTGFMLGDRGPAVWGVGLAMGASLAAASVLVAYARRSTG